MQETIKCTWEISVPKPDISAYLSESSTVTESNTVTTGTVRTYTKSNESIFCSIAGKSGYLTLGKDAIQLITYIRNEIGCNPDKTNSNYCPIITVSYIFVCCVVLCVLCCVVWRYSHSLTLRRPLSLLTLLFTFLYFLNCIL